MYPSIDVLCRAGPGRPVYLRRGTPADRPSLSACGGPGAETAGSGQTVPCRPSTDLSTCIAHVHRARRISNAIRNIFLCILYAVDVVNSNNTHMCVYRMVVFEKTM